MGNAGYWNSLCSRLTVYASKAISLTSIFSFLEVQISGEVNYTLREVDLSFRSIKCFI